MYNKTLFLKIKYIVISISIILKNISYQLLVTLGCGGCFLVFFFVVILYTLMITRRIIVFHPIVSDRPAFLG
ncbi:unnamed protein product [Aphis gossypii]|uniref:Uncharacterized protein n=1 Tax=Aphis gossypii TaxID=80765 RepID=A0A9P0J0H6_APHGO|nr:unnamed protein product [Aphis gossypii]